MISNLFTAIRDNKASQLVQGATTGGSGDKQEPKGGFGLIFQTLQGEGSSEDGKNQQTLAGQTETSEGETPATETKAVTKDVAKESSASILPKIQVTTGETAQASQAEEIQTEEKKEVAVIETESQSKSNTIITQEETKEIGNDGEVVQTSDQSKLNIISSTDGFSSIEVKDATTTSEKVIVEEKASIRLVPKINEAAQAPQGSNGGIISDGGIIPEDGDPKQEVAAIKSGKVANQQETVSVQSSNSAEAGKPLQEIIQSESDNISKVDAQKEVADTNQKPTVSPVTSGEQNSVLKDLPDVSKVVNNVIPTGDNEVKQDGPVQAGRQPDDQKTITTQNQVSANQEQTAGVFRPANDQIVEVKTGELQGTAKPNLSESAKQGVKIDHPLTAKNELHLAAKEEPAVHVRSEITVNQKEIRVVDIPKEEQGRGPVLTTADPQKTQDANSGSNSISVTEENQQKLVQDMFINKGTPSPLENGVVPEKIIGKDIREKKYGDRSTGFENRGEVMSERGKRISEWQSSQLWSDKMNAFTGRQSQSNHPFSSQETTIADEDLPWNKHSMDISQLKENKAAEQQMMSFSRLMEIPVFNLSVRRNLMPALTQTVLKASTGNNTLTENWQKHNFSLENGKNLQLSMRQVDGVVYLKLNSTHNELTRLLVQHQNEIREHLQKECNLEVDLQFEDNGDQDLSQFFDDSSSSRKRGWSGKSVLSGGKSLSERESQDVQRTIRKFGYNRMEWMA